MNADILDEIMALASPRRTVAEILDLSLGIILPWLRQAVGGAYLVHGDTVQLVAQQGLGARWIGPSPLPLAGMDRIASLNRARVLRPSEMVHWGLAQAAGEWVIQSLLLLPLDRQRLRGFLLMGLPNALTLSRAKRRSLSTVGYAVGLAMRSADPSARTNEQMPRLKAILEMSRALSAAPDPDAALKAIVRAAVQGAPSATSGTMHFFESHEEAPLAGAPANVGPSEGDTEEARLIALGQRVAPEALEKERAICIADIAEDIRFADMTWPLFHGSLLVAPLQIQERPIGMLILGSPQPDAFTQADEQVVMSLAATAAEVVTQRAPSTRKETEAGEPNHFLCRDLCRLLLGVAHDLRNPLTAVMGYAQLLQATETSGALAIRDLDKIQKQAQKAARIVNNLSAFARHCGASEKANPDEVLKQILALCAHALEAKNIRLTTDFSPQDLTVKILASSLQQVLLRLISYVRDRGLDQGGYLHIATEAGSDQARVRCIFGLWEVLPISAGDGGEDGFPEAVPPELSLCSDIIQGFGGTVRYLDMGGMAKMWVAELPLAREAEWERTTISLGESDRVAGT